MIIMEINLFKQNRKEHVFKKQFFSTGSKGLITMVKNKNELIALVCSGFFDNSSFRRIAFVLESDEFIDAGRIADGLKKTSIFNIGLTNDLI